MGGGGARGLHRDLIPEKGRRVVWGWLGRGRPGGAGHSPRLRGGRAGTENGAWGGGTLRGKSTSLGAGWTQDGGAAGLRTSGVHREGQKPRKSLGELIISLGDLVK